MKNILIMCSVLLVSFLASGEQPPVPPLSARVHDIDFIAFVSITNVTRTTYGDGIHPVTGTNLYGMWTVGRILKGHLLTRYPFKIHQDFSMPYLYRLKEGRFLIFGIWGGDSCTPRGYYDLAPVFGTGLDTDRVLWPNCNSVSEVVAEITKELAVTKPNRREDKP